MLYTRKGDRGYSGLFNTKKRLPKDHIVYDALGTLDELNSFLGACRAHTTNIHTNEEIDLTREILNVQETLFIIQAELAGSNKKVLQQHIKNLEKTINTTEILIKNPHAFVVPGATMLSAWFDIARAITRRTERSVIKLRTVRNISTESKIYLNRLSSLLYVFARYVAQLENKDETSPSYK